MNLMIVEILSRRRVIKENLLRAKSVMTSLLQKKYLYQTRRLLFRVMIRRHIWMTILKKGNLKSIFPKKIPL